MVMNPVLAVSLEMLLQPAQTAGAPTERTTRVKILQAFCKSEMSIITKQESQILPPLLNEKNYSSLQRHQNPPPTPGCWIGPNKHSSASSSEKQNKLNFYIPVMIEEMSLLTSPLDLNFIFKILSELKNQLQPITALFSQFSHVTQSFSTQHGR